VRCMLEICGDESAQITAERNIVRWTIIERSNANMQEVFGDLTCFFCQAMNKVATNASFRQDPCAVAGDAHEIARLIIIDSLKRIENRSDEHCTPIMCLDVVSI